MNVRTGEILTAIPLSMVVLFYFSILGVVEIKVINTIDFYLLDFSMLLFIGFIHLVLRTAKGVSNSYIKDIVPNVVSLYSYWAWQVVIVFVCGLIIISAMGGAYVDFDLLTLYPHPVFLYSLSGIVLVLALLTSNILIKNEIK